MHDGNSRYAPVLHLTKVVGSAAALLRRLQVIRENRAQRKLHAARQAMLQSDAMHEIAKLELRQAVLEAENRKEMVRQQATNGRVTATQMLANHCFVEASKPDIQRYEISLDKARQELVKAQSKEQHERQNYMRECKRVIKIEKIEEHDRKQNGLAQEVAAEDIIDDLPHKVGDG